MQARCIHKYKFEHRVLCDEHLSRDVAEGSVSPSLAFDLSESSR